MIVSCIGCSGGRSLPQSKNGSLTTARGTCGALSAVFGCVGVVEVVGEAGRVPVDLAVDRLGVRVEEQLGRVAPQALGRLPRSVHPVAVALAGPDVGQVGVPAVPVDLGQLDAHLGLASLARGRRAGTARRPRRRWRTARSWCPTRRRWRRAGTRGRPTGGAAVARGRGPVNEEASGHGRRWSMILDGVRVVELAAWVAGRRPPGSSPTGAPTSSRSSRRRATRSARIFGAVGARRADVGAAVRARQPWQAQRRARPAQRRGARGDGPPRSPRPTSS